MGAREIVFIPDSPIATMPLKTAFKGEVKYLQVLNEKGKLDKKLMPKVSAAKIKKMYEWMVLTRIFDDTALSLQREGRILTYAPMRGQEAAQIGSAFALQKGDWMVPCFRENGAMMMRGFSAENLYMYWAGDERGMIIPEGSNCLPIAIPVGTQTVHGVGIAWASRLRKEKTAAIVYFGDGATSKGDFHEALNFAGVLKAPVVFVCQNNQWAISLPREKQSASETLAQKALAYGFPGIQVDGNDVLAVYRATKEAIDRARAGKGPTLIECFTYRIADHTTADDASKYRSKKEVEQWKKKDPIDRLRIFMKKKKMWTAAYEKKLLEGSRKKILDAVKKMESMPAPDPKDIFKYTYAEKTKRISEQEEELLGPA